MSSNLNRAYPAPVSDDGMLSTVANDTQNENHNEATPPAGMHEGERLTRAREAWISAYRPFRWVARRIRAGKHDARLRSILIALEDVKKPMALIVADRDEATVALILRTTPGLTKDQATVAALLTAIRMGRRG